MLRRAGIILLATVSLTLLLGLAAAAVDKEIVVGTWQQETSQPRGAGDLVKIEVQNKGLKLVLDRMEPGGILFHTEFVGKTDGKDYAVSGMTDADAVSLQRIDSHTVDCSYKKGRELVKMERIVISKDGTKATVFRKEKNSPPQDYTVVSAWNKQ